MKFKVLDIALIVAIFLVLAGVLFTGLAGPQRTIQENQKHRLRRQRERIGMQLDCFERIRQQARIYCDRELKQEELSSLVPNVLDKAA